MGMENERKSIFSRLKAWLTKEFRRDVFTHLGLPPSTVDGQKGPKAGGDAAPKDH